MAQPPALRGAFDQTRQIGHDELVVVAAHDAQLRLQRREGIVGDLGSGAGRRREEGRLAGIRQTDEPDIGDQLEPQPDPALLARPTGIGTPRRLIGRGFVMGIAEAGTTRYADRASRGRR
jgi:hypothetical protein